MRRRRLHSNARPEPPVRTADGSLSTLGRSAGSRSPLKLATSDGFLCAPAHGRARERRSRSLRTALVVPVSKKELRFAACRSYMRVPVVHLITCVVVSARVSLHLPFEYIRYVTRLRRSNGAVCPTGEGVTDTKTGGGRALDGKVTLAFSVAKFARARKIGIR